MRGRGRALAAGRVPACRRILLASLEPPLPRHTPWTTLRAWPRVLIGAPKLRSVFACARGGGFLNGAQVRRFAMRYGTMPLLLAALGSAGRTVVSLAADASPLPRVTLGVDGGLTVVAVQANLFAASNLFAARRVRRRQHVPWRPRQGRRELLSQWRCRREGRAECAFGAGEWRERRGAGRRRGSTGTTCAAGRTARCRSAPSCPPPWRMWRRRRRMTRCASCGPTASRAAAGARCAACASATATAIAIAPAIDAALWPRVPPLDVEAAAAGEATRRARPVLCVRGGPRVARRPLRPTVAPQRRADFV